MPMQWLISGMPYLRAWFCHTLVCSLCVLVMYDFLQFVQPDPGAEVLSKRLKQASHASLPDCIEIMKPLHSVCY